MLRDALLHGRTCNIFFLPLLTKVDLFGVGPSPFDQIEFVRRKPAAVRATGETLILKTPEDTVIRKLLWYRDGGEVSEKQWRDIVEVLLVSGPLMDRAYLTSWVNRLGLSDLLARAQAEASTHR